MQFNFDSSPIPMPKGNFVYRIRNLKTQVCYVGATTNATRRLELHCTNLRTGNHHCRRLQADWDSLGAGSFVFEFVESVESKKELPLREQRAINDHGCARSAKCYNARDVLHVKTWPAGWFEETLQVAEAMLMRGTSAYTAEVPKPLELSTPA